jgi:hypothetical protein
MLCCTWVAGAYVLFPDWFASITHVPAALKVTTPEVIVHTALDELSTVIVAESPELAVAAGVYVPATWAEDGAVEVKAIVCEVATGVTALLEAEGDPVPTRFVAVTAKV